MAALVINTNTMREAYSVALATRRPVCAHQPQRPRPTCIAAIHLVFSFIKLAGLLDGLVLFYVFREVLRLVALPALGIYLQTVVLQIMFESA